MILRGESGSVTAGTTVLFPGILIGIAMLFDLLLLNNHRSHLQAQADLAALEAARYTTDAGTALRQARNSVRLNDAFSATPPAPGQVTLGRWEDGSFEIDGGSPLRPNAARVEVASTAKTNLTALLKRGFDKPIARQATALADERVSFALSNCLASLSLLQGALRPLLGSDLDLLCSSAALSLRTDLLLETLALDLDAPLTYGDVLDAEIGLARLWSLALGANVPVPPGTIRLGELLHLDEASRELTLGAGLPGGRVAGADLVFASLELMGRNGLDLDFSADLGPLANLPVRLTVLEPRRIVSNAEPGAPGAYAETAQIRLAVDGLDLLGLVQLDLDLRVAQASARLGPEGSICRPPGTHPAARFVPVESGLAGLEVALSAGGLTLTDEIELVATGTRSLSFSAQEVEQRVSKRVAPRIDGTAQSAAHQATDLLGQLAPDGLTSAVGGLLSGVASLATPLETLLGQVVHDFVGLAIAPASLTVLEANCTIRLVQ